MWHENQLMILGVADNVEGVCKVIAAVPHKYHHYAFDVNTPQTFRMRVEEVENHTIIEVNGLVMRGQGVKAAVQENVLGDWSEFMIMSMKVS